MTTADMARAAQLAADMARASTTKVADLTGADLALWMARADGHHDAFCWKDHAGRMQVFLRPSDSQPYMPHESWNDCGPALALMLNAGGMLMRPDRAAPFALVTTLGRWLGDTPQEAICRARVALRYGDEVSDAR